MGPAYWVLLSASRLHDGFAYLYNQLQSSTIYNTLMIPEMIEKFGAAPDDDLNILSLVSSAIVIASAFAGRLAAPMTVAIGAFGLGSQFMPSPPDITADISTQLAGAFYNAQVQLEETVANVFGGENEMLTEDLPMQIGDYTDAMARFFAEGKFLVQDIQSSMQNVFDEFISVQGSTYMQPSVACV